MISERPYDPTNRAQVVGELRREILAARLRVTIDERLGRETPPVATPVIQDETAAGSAIVPSLPC